MSKLEALKDRIPEYAKDLRVNLQTVLEPGSLNDAQRWGVAVACAIATRHAGVREAIAEAAQGQVDAAVLEDARAAASLMGMNNVFYRFRHLVGKDSYASIPARLRMQRIAKPATNKVDFELFCLAVSAINACESCIKSHEKVVLEGGLTEAQVNDAVRIASVLEGAALALESAEVG
jgi:alkyl hydroperoxide reductase subunit D